MAQSNSTFEIAERKGAHVASEEVEVAKKHGPVEFVGEEEGERLEATKSTNDDQYQMERLGRKQVLVRHFRPMSTFSFVAMATSVWEFGIFSATQGLVAGGRAGLFWTTAIHAIGFFPIVLSMAEMSSIAPTAGGQYHWVSEFAPAKYQKWLSYLTGWISTIAWQAGNAIGVFLTGTLIQVIILENNPNYAFPAWHGSLLVISNIIFTVTANIWLTRYIPRVQTLFFCLHVMAFFAVIIPICAFAPKASTEQVVTEFKDFGGWGNIGFATLAGQLSAIYMMCGADSAAHISEEVRDAAKTVPRSMLSVFIVNMVITFACWLVILFAMPDIPAALEHVSLYPVVYVMEQSMSIKWVTVELTLIVALVLFANVCYITAVSRDLFAFARDGGLPCSEWISAIHPKHHAPVNAIYVTAAFSFILSLIYIGSPTAFYAITSLFTVALLQCYMFSIGLILWRRIALPETIPEARAISLGKWGIPVNAVAFVWCAWAFFWSFWTMYKDPGASDFNWSVAIFGAVAVIAVVWYFIRGHKTYHGPVTLVKRF